MKHNHKNNFFMGPEKIPYFAQFCGKILKISRTYKIKHSNELNIKSK